MVEYVYFGRRRYHSAALENWEIDHTTLTHAFCFSARADHIVTVTTMLLRWDMSARYVWGLFATVLDPGPCSTRPRCVSPLVQDLPSLHARFYGATLVEPTMVAVVFTDETQAKFWSARVAPVPLFPFSPGSTSVQPCISPHQSGSAFCSPFGFDPPLSLISGSSTF